MPKAYWVTIYRAVTDPEKLTAYGKLSVPAIIAAGGKILARGLPHQIYDEGMTERVVVIEFSSVEDAIKAHDSPAYQLALKALGDGAARDIRIVEGMS